MINTNLPPILYRFRDIAVDRSKIAIFGYPSCVTPRRRGSPGTISVKFSVDVNGWPKYQWRRNIAQNFNRLSKVHERYRQTDDRQTTDWRTTAYSEFTFAKKQRPQWKCPTVARWQHLRSTCKITTSIGIQNTSRITSKIQSTLLWSMTAHSPNLMKIRP